MPHARLVTTMLVFLFGSGLGAAPLQAQPLTSSQLQGWIEAMHSEARQLEDIAAIARLQRAYGYYIDKGYWNEAADLFAADATLEIGVDGVYRGQDRIRRMLIRYGEGSPDTGPGLPFGQMVRHMQLQPVITLDPDGLHAKARWRDFALLGRYQESAHWGDGIMENSYVKADGVWKLQALRLFTNFVAPYEGGWARLEAAPQDWRSAAAREIPPDAPPTLDYRPFPEAFAPPFHYPLQPPMRQRWSERITNVTWPAELQPLRESVEGYAAELDRLWAERAIENLQARYGYYIDKGLWDEAASLFSREATYEFGQGGVYVGNERIHQALELMGPPGLDTGQLNNYPMLQPIITVAPDALSASARWRSDVQLSRDGQGTWGGGVYENTYVNENGEWKLSKLHYYVTFWANYDKGWVDGTFPMPRPSTALPPDLPPTEVYGSQPEVYLFPFSYPHLVTKGPHRGTGGDNAQ
ncbi:MAG TPA: nuclear transport factor 2 family protein [Hyphomicrobiales bacterium]|nr:nuclear transport factor 2 family protein [Hyphomicrobiales bacterium]